MSKVDYVKLVNFIDRNAHKITSGNKKSAKGGGVNFYTIDTEYVCKNHWSLDKDDYDFTFKGNPIKGDLARRIFDQTKMLYHNPFTQIKKNNVI